MPADIYYHPREQTEPGDLTAEFINSGKICWTEKVGDKLGNPVFIGSEGDEVQYCMGRFEGDASELLFTTMGNFKTVMPGTENVLVVYSRESGEEYLLHIRNLGSSAITPSLN